MSTDSFVKLWRKTRDSDVFRDEGVWHLFTYLLISAEPFATTAERTRGKGMGSVSLLPGQLVTSEPDLVRELGVCRKTIHTRLEKLESLDAITRVKDGNDTIVTIANWLRYQPSKQHDLGCNKKSQPNDLGCDQKAQPNGQNVTQKAQPKGCDTTSLKKENKEKNAARSSGKGSPDDFETFWSAYPRHDAKGAAVKAYAKAIRMIAPTDLLAIVKVFAASDKGQAGKFCPQAATFLNQQRWTDDPATWADTSPAGNGKTQKPAKSFNDMTLEEKEEAYFGKH